MAKNLFAIGTCTKLSSKILSETLGKKVKHSIFNSGYNVYYVDEVSLNTKFFIAWSDVQSEAEINDYSWFSIIIGEDHDDIEIESFEATIDDNEDYLLHEIFGIETIINYNFT